MSDQLATVAIPSHVPPELVLDYSLAQGKFTYDNGFRSVIPAIHDEMPEIFYSPMAGPGMTPAWVVRRAEDLKRIYLDTEHFTSHGLAPFSMLVGETWSMVPLEIDPPQHGHYRAMMNALFLPKAVRKLEEKSAATLSNISIHSRAGANASSCGNSRSNILSS